MEVYEARLAEKEAVIAGLHAELFRLRREREGMLREIDELAAFMERTTSSLPYRLARRIASAVGR